LWASLAFLMLKRIPFLFLLIFPAATPSQTITVNWDTPKQTIDGFGASSAIDGPMPSEKADFFWSQSKGIGLSIVRTGMIPNLSDCRTYYPDCITVRSGATSLKYDLAEVQQAMARGVTKVVSSSWSAPGSMKTNGVYKTGGSFLGNPTNYREFASVFVSYLTFMKNQDVAVNVVGIQNEPDTSTDYPSTLWTAQQFHDFIPYLHSALTAAGFGSVKILFPEPATWSANFGGFTAATMTDASAAPLVGVLGMHAYGRGKAVGLPDYGYGQHVWQTEVSGINKYDGSWKDARRWASEIHDFLTISNANAWLYFQTQEQDPQFLGDNEGLTDANGNIPKRAYAIGNWSKFVRPGWHRVNVKNPTGLRVTAFENASGTLGAVVVLNVSRYPVPDQVLEVGTILGSPLTPWITSASYDLQPLSPVGVNNGTLTYTIPANSVITFYSIEASASLSAPVANSRSQANSAMIFNSAGASFWQTFFGLIGLFCAIVALIFAFVSRRKSRRNTP
jgi:glucuronoarabinoxylan endo-1,4-beta-xylanase